MPFDLKLPPDNKYFNIHHVAKDVAKRSNPAYVRAVNQRKTKDGLLSIALKKLLQNYSRDVAHAIYTELETFNYKKLKHNMERLKLL